MSLSDEKKKTLAHVYTLEWSDFIWGNFKKLHMITTIKKIFDNFFKILRSSTRASALKIKNLIVEATF
jgi:hypothetical protein